MIIFSEEVDEILREVAGWFPDRRVDMAAWIDYFNDAGIPGHDAARRFLAEFGGLNVIVFGKGVDRGRLPFKLDPARCYGEEDRFSDWGETIGKSLYPIGEVDGGRFFLGMDEFGVVYILETWIASFGVMPDAMEKLVLGIRADLIDNGSSG